MSTQADHPIVAQGKKPQSFREDRLRHVTIVKLARALLLAPRYCLIQIRDSYEYAYGQSGMHSNNDRQQLVPLLTKG